MERYDYFGRHYANERHQEYLRLIHDLSKKLSTENVQSITFLRHSSTDCYGYPAAPCVHGAFGPGPAAMTGPTNRGLEVLEQLWQNGVFSETNLEPLVKLLKDIGRHDLADECSEKSLRIGCGGYRPPPPIPVPPTLYDPEFRDGVYNERAEDMGDSQTDNSNPSSSKPSIPTSIVSPISASTTDNRLRPLQTSKASQYQISRSFPVQCDSGGTEKDDASPLSATAPSRWESSTLSEDIPVTLSKRELDKILQCIGRDSDPKLKEKLINAVSSHDDLQSSKDGVKQHKQAIHSTMPPTKLVTNSGYQMAADVVNFSPQASPSRNQLRQQDPDDGKFVLRRQKSVIHVKSIDTPIPALLTPQPQRSHKKLEACSSNSSTDSGLSQCRSQRSSTISNTSSSAFLSEDEEEQKDRKEGELLHEVNSISADSASVVNQHNDGEATLQRVSSHTAQSEKKEIQSTSERSRESVRKVKHNEAHKPRRQSESTTDVKREESRERRGSKKGHAHAPRKRNRAISLPELPPLNPLAKTGMTIDWRIARDSFIDPIFHHKNKLFERKCRFSTGSGSSTLNIQLAIRLYPNGINWDNGAYSTLKVEMTSTSRPPPHTAYIQFEIKGYDCYAGHVIASRQVEYPLSKGAFVIPEFLSHEIIKISHAKNFDFRATIKIKYLVCRDWVVVGADQVGATCSNVV